jgi:hypothetical protein
MECRKQHFSNIYEQLATICKDLLWVDAAGYGLYCSGLCTLDWRMKTTYRVWKEFRFNILTR